MKINIDSIISSFLWYWWLRECFFVSILFRNVSFIFRKLFHHRNILWYVLTADNSCISHEICFSCLNQPNLNSKGWYHLFISWIEKLNVNFLWGPNKKPSLIILIALEYVYYLGRCINHPIHVIIIFFLFLSVFVKTIMPNWNRKARTLILSTLG